MSMQGTPAAGGDSTGAWEDHPLRARINDEIHARPYETVRAPTRVTHLGLYTGRGGVQTDHDAVAALCERYGIAPPAPGARHLSADFGPFRLKWERRTEASTYTFYVEGDVEQPFLHNAIDAVPQEWLAALPGKRLIGVHLVFEPDTAPKRTTDELVALFNHNTVVGSYIAGGSARVTTDFRVHGDGFSRILLRDLNLGERQAGRAVQRLLEIETYRMMAMLAFPMAREIGPQLSTIEEQLGHITNDLSGEHASDERGLLESLSGEAARLERLVNHSDYRFKAADAYYALVQRRIEELREARIQGLQTIQEFIERRMDPAMRTCQTVVDRQRSLSERISRAGDLLRTRVDVGLEAQNRDLLASMNRRAQLQFRLQETVEGLSVAAVSYYLMGLLGYMLEAAHDAGYLQAIKLTQGLMVPAVVVTIWLLIRIVRHRIARRSDGPPAGGVLP